MANKNQPPGIFTKAFEANTYWIEYCAFCFDHIGKPNDKLCRKYALTRQELSASKGVLQARRADYERAFYPMYGVFIIASLSPPLVRVTIISCLLYGISYLAAGARRAVDQHLTLANNSRAVIFTAARDKWMSARQAKMRAGQRQAVSAPA